MVHKTCKQYLHCLLLEWLINNQESIILHDQELAVVANQLCYNKFVNSQTGLISFPTKRGTVEDVTMMLDAYGICVRGGKLCAEPLVSTLTPANGVIRVSWGAYTTKEEIKFVFETIEEIDDRISKYV